MKNTIRIAVYPGSFDPITLGHIDVIKRAIKLFDKLIITVGNHKNKTPLFDTNERINLIKDATKDLNNIDVISSEKLIVELANEKKAIALIRGIRFVSDMEFEFQLAWMNRNLNSEIITVFLMTDAKFTHLNSSIIKEVNEFGGNIDDFVTPEVSKKLKEKLNSK